MARSFCTAASQPDASPHSSFCHLHLHSGRPHPLNQPTWPPPPSIISTSTRHAATDAKLPASGEQKDQGAGVAKTRDGRMLPVDQRGHNMICWHHWRESNRYANLEDSTQPWISGCAHRHCAHRPTAGSCSSDRSSVKVCGIMAPPRNKTPFAQENKSKRAVQCQRTNPDRDGQFKTRPASPLPAAANLVLLVCINPGSWVLGGGTNLPPTVEALSPRNKT